MTVQQRKVINKIKMEINRAFLGVSEYEEKLEDTCVITDHLYEVEQLLDELKEMI